MWIFFWPIVLVLTHGVIDTHSKYEKEKSQEEQVCNQDEEC